MIWTFILNVDWFFFSLIVYFCERLSLKLKISITDIASGESVSLESEVNLWVKSLICETSGKSDYSLTIRCPLVLSDFMTQELDQNNVWYTFCNVTQSLLLIYHLRLSRNVSIVGIQYGWLRWSFRTWLHQMGTSVRIVSSFYAHQIQALQKCL